MLILKLNAFVQIATTLIEYEFYPRNYMFFCKVLKSAFRVNVFTINYYIMSVC